MFYSIVFKDGSSFLGGDYKNTKWQEIPNKPIKTIFYSLPLGDNIIMTQYDAYYHFIEVTKDLMGEKKGEIQLEYSYLIGKRGNRYKIYKVSLRNGQMLIFNVDDSDKLIKELNPIGWKNGK